VMACSLPLLALRLMPFNGHLRTLVWTLSRH